MYNCFAILLAVALVVLVFYGLAALNAPRFPR
jgi:hypothetical protein